MPEPLTDLERQILDFIVEYLRENTYQPSIREIGRRFDIKSTKTVSEYLQALAEKGWVERDPSRSRGVRLLGLDLRGRAQAGAAGVPTMVVEEGDGAPVGARSTVELTAADAVWNSRAGDVALVEPLAAAPDAGVAIVVRDGTGVYLGRAEEDGKRTAVRDAAGRKRPLVQGAGDGAELLGRALGFWRPVAGSAPELAVGEAGS